MKTFSVEIPLIDAVNSGTVIGFEGPEKRLEITFSPSSPFPNTSSSFLRSLHASEWQTILDHAKCTIVSSMKNEFLDAYLLSESSLFVFPTKMMIKTCGTTTLLNVIPVLLNTAAGMGLKVDKVVYSRKNFNFPAEQKNPHKSWNEEVVFLSDFFEGSAHVLGPLNGDHWYLYVADYVEDSGSAIDVSNVGDAGLSDDDFVLDNSCGVTLEIMMHDLNPNSARQFYEKEGRGEKDKFPGMDSLIGEAETDEFNFTPCGYSMNGMKNDAFYTIHVTPEPHCSYASFETNVRSSSYVHIVRRVLDVFGPKRASIVITRGNASRNVPSLSSSHGYKPKFRTNIDLLYTNVFFCNYVLSSSPSLPAFPPLDHRLIPEVIVSC